MCLGYVTVSHNRRFRSHRPRAAAQYSMPIAWVTARAGLPHILASGSAFLLDCGEGPFGVTARHVLAGFRQDRASHPDAVCMLEQLRFDPVERAIAKDSAYEVATFRILPDEVRQLRPRGKVALTGGQRTWPREPPQAGRGVFFVGFAGTGRAMRPYRGGNVVEIDWGIFTALATADTVSDTSVSLVLQHDPEVARSSPVMVLRL